MMSTKFTAGTAALPTSEVELSLSCRSLARADVFSKSDPMCVTFVRPFGEDRWVEYHRTEVIDNCHDPQFASKILMAYRFEEQQHIKFEVYDVDSSSTNLSDHDFLGRATCTLAQIVSSTKVELPLSDSLKGRKLGSIVVLAEELESLKDEVLLQFSAHQLDKKKWWWFGKSDPFLVISKVTESGAYTVVHRTEVAKHTLNPRWRKFRLPVRLLCNGDYERTIKLSCYHYAGVSGDHVLIGECSTTLQRLSQGLAPSNDYRCINPDMIGKSSYKSSGEIRLVHFEKHKIHSFMDYVKGGLQLHCSIAIDFTASNGDPLLPTSLHHVGPSPNLYEQAILSVGTIIQDYDTDKMFPVLGFGARIPPAGHVSHEFFVNMSADPYCQGIQGVLAAYRSCLQQVQLFGPTNFAPVINHVARFAATYRDGSSYFILLILTDGIITDMPQTTKALVDASMLPMSLIIVGIGEADFSAMETLDADTVPLQSGGRRAARDIVQFVPYSKFLGLDASTARSRLAREVLAEIPGQVTGYMKANNLEPRTQEHQDPVLLPPDPSLLPAS